MVAPTRTGGSAQHAGDEDLAKKSQNPITEWYELVGEADREFQYGPGGRLVAETRRRPAVICRLA